MTGYHDSLYLRGPLSDLADLRVAHHSLDGIVLRVAVATVDLDGLQRGPHRKLGTEKLRDRGFLSERFPVLGQPGGMEHQMLPCLDFSRHVRELELDSLEARNGTPELPSPRCVIQRLLSAFGDSEREGGDSDATRVERLHEVDEAHSVFAEPVLHRYFDILEDELPGIRGPPAQLVFLFSSSEARHYGERRLVTDVDVRATLREIGLLGHYERRDALGIERWICDGRDDEDLAHSAVRDEHLRSVEDVVIVLADSGRAGPCCIAARGRLGQTESAEHAPRREERYVELVLPGGAEVHYRRRAKSRMCGDRDRVRGVDLRHLVYDDEVAEDVEPGAAE